MAKKPPTFKLAIDDLLQEDVAAASLSHYASGHYRDAVLNAVIAVYDLIRKRTGVKADGSQLTGQTTALGNARLVFSELDSETGKNDQKGMHQMIEGAYMGIRNVKAHTLEHDVTEMTAAQYLVFLSLLARRVEEATVVPRPVAPTPPPTPAPSPQPPAPLATPAPAPIPPHLVAAARLEAKNRFAEARDKFRHSDEGVGKALEAYDSAVKELKIKVEEIRSASPSLGIQIHQSGRVFGVGAKGASLLVELCQQYANSFDGLVLNVSFWNGAPPMPGQHFFDQPKKIASVQYEPDMTESLRLAWIRQKLVLDNSQMIDEIIEQWTTRISRQA